MDPNTIGRWFVKNIAQDVASDTAKRGHGNKIEAITAPATNTPTTA